jgi:hypothetical protein
VRGLVSNVYFPNRRGRSRFTFVHTGQVCLARLAKTGGYWIPDQQAVSHTRYGIQDGKRVFFRQLLLEAIRHSTFLFESGIKFYDSNINDNSEESRNSQYPDVFADIDPIMLADQQSEKSK